MGFKLARFPNLSGVQSNPYNLQTMNLQQDELAFTSSMRMEVQALQEDIDQLAQFRSASQEFTTKPHITQVSKWLKANSGANAKQLLEHRMAMQVEPAKLLDALNQKDPLYSAAHSLSKAKHS